MIEAFNWNKTNSYKYEICNHFYSYSPENVVLGNPTANGSSVLINNKAKQNIPEDSVGLKSKITIDETMTNSANSSNSNKSDDDIIEGTPGKCDVL